MGAAFDRCAIRVRLKQLLAETYFVDADDISDDESLMDQGVIDSSNIETVSTNTLSSVNKIIAYVESEMSASRWPA
jgi:hypothetical protein